MAVCPKCMYEYVEGVTVCPDCDAELVDSIEEVSLSELTCVFECGEVYVAEMVKANLESGGISAFIMNKKDSSYVAMGNLSVVRLYVRSEDAEAAQQYINEAPKAEIPEDQTPDE